MWEINVADQTWSFILSLGLGCVLCLFYDVLRAYRYVVKPSNTAVFFEDLFYFCLAALLTFCLMLVTTAGQIRGFVYAGIALGFAVFRLTLSVWLIKAFVFVIRILKRFFGFIKGKIRLVFSAFYRFGSFLGAKIIKICKNVLLTFKKLLHINTHIVYNQND